MRESSLEGYLRKQAEARGGRAIKFVSPQENGWPDRIVILPYLPVAWVETKARSVHDLSPIQRHRLRQLSRMGQLVAVVWTQEGADRLFEVMSAWRCG